MRIFHAVSPIPEATLTQSQIWSYNLELPLRDLGHELVLFQWDYTDRSNFLDPSAPLNKESINRHRARLSDELLRQVKAAHSRSPIDLFFSYFYSPSVETSAIREIGKLGIVTVNWYCNASYQFDLVSEIAPAYNYCLVPEKFRLDDYRRIGANPIYCQEAANPNIYHPYDVTMEYDVTFVGQRYGTRPQYLRHLLDNGIDVRAWGPGWLDPRPQHPLWLRAGSKVKRTLLHLLGEPLPAFPRERCAPPLSDEELIKMYSRSRISLGFTTVADRSGIKQVRLRDFEAPMSGAFYMVEAFDELSDFFEPDREVVMFNSFGELNDKVQYYLRHDAEREAIRQAGMRRARSEHTWHKRFAMVFREMGLQ
jgi:spore maturation protein CgeB